MSASSQTAHILRVAIDAPVMQFFDYLAPPGGHISAGQRVRVPFRKGERVGVVLALVSRSEIPEHRLRRALGILDDEPLLDDNLMSLLQWAAGYYQHPPGEVFASALPRLLRQGRNSETRPLVWRITQSGRDAHAQGLDRRAPAQARLLEALVSSEGLGREELQALSPRWAPLARALTDKGWVEAVRDCGSVLTQPACAGDEPPPLTDAQREAVAAIEAAGRYQAFLLEGVTGSGKTEVYLQAIASFLRVGRQCLVLVPEIGLTPQLVQRFQRRFPDTTIALLHSGLSDLQRLESWTAARDGRAGVIIGTRSAVFVPLRSAGLIVVDEEHDTSFKQQEGFRYSARDLAVWRAHQLDTPVVLGSATPSLESIANIKAGRYRLLRLPHRAGIAQPPSVQLTDLRRHAATDGLTQPVIAAIARHLAAGGQVLLYLNRRGYAPVLMCPDCGGCLECRRCDARLVLHRQEQRVVCHHCGSSRAIPQNCEACHGELVTVGHGTERLEAAVGALFPDHPLIRIDRDTTRARGEIGRRLGDVASGRTRILLGTQMLTKGHDFPGVTLVVIVDADQGLFGTDFRASEKLAQTFIQVSGRAGRGERPGEVYIQTMFPEHPLLQVLVREGYDSFAEAALAERRSALWPPFSYLALLRAEAPRREAAMKFLAGASAAAQELNVREIRLLGPTSAPMEKRGGRFRAQLLVQTAARARLQEFLAAWRPLLADIPGAARTRWSLDVDPVELF